MANEPAEDKWAELNALVARVRAEKAKEYKRTGIRPGVTGQTSPDFLDTMFGIHANSPMFEEVTREIEANRERQREEAQRLFEEDEAVAALVSAGQVAHHAGGVACG